MRDTSTNRSARRARPALTVMTALSAFALLAGCAAAGPADPTPDATEEPAGALRAVAESDVTAVVERVAGELGFPGAVAFVRTPTEAYIVEYGVTELGGSEPVSVNQHVRVGSNTKTWVGTVILQLAQEERLSLDDPVAEYIPGVPDGELITIEQLLTMRSGLVSYTVLLEFNEAMDAEPQRAWMPDELLAYAYSAPGKLGPGQNFAPGQGYEYSNTNTVLLGLIAEQLDGRPLEQILEERLFAPLGMTDTLFPAVTSHEIPEPYSRGYMFGDNVLTMGSPPAVPEDMQAAASAGTLLPRDFTHDNPSWGWAAGAGISTAVDLATWVDALTDGSLLEDEYQALRLASPASTNPDGESIVRYGLGIAKFGPLYGHSGELPGYNSFMGSDPVNDVTVVVWANLAPSANGSGPAVTMARELIGLIYAPAQ